MIFPSNFSTQGSGDLSVPWTSFEHEDCVRLSPPVYPDGRVCISILHPPGDDEFGYESADVRWSPVHTVEAMTVPVEDSGKQQ